MNVPGSIGSLLVVALSATASPCALAGDADPAAMATRLVVPPDRYEILSILVAGASLPAHERYELVDAAGPDSSGRARLRLRVRSDAGVLAHELMATVRGVVRGPALVARRTLARGVKVSPADLELRDCDLTRSTAEPLRDLAALVDRVPLRTIGAGRSLTEDLFRAAPVVHRGHPVELRYQTRGLTVVAAGTARADGAPDEMIRALNAASGVEVVGRVTRDGALVVAGPISSWRNSR